ncbi:MAG: hypothetical protein AUK44_10420 [Porphyromonadaceae bacterium CG2_30_38_12]|nr:MAG: hypothetical protein AUK44_10420 [Porphyromonadaceae bacterium CG2_30_38_12]
MFGNNHNVFHARCFSLSATLVGVKLFGVECFEVECAVAPLFVLIGVYPKMHKHTKAQIHPCLLGWKRDCC